LAELERQSPGLKYGSAESSGTIPTAACQNVLFLIGWKAPMKLNHLLNQGILLEETISACYEALARLSSDKTISWRLNRMALEEKNHANILRSGKSYIKMAPAAFGSEIMTIGEVKAGIGLAQDLLRMIRQTSNLEDGLKMLLDLERRFEKIHLDTAVEIRDASLKKLFHDLAQEDKTHTQALEEILSSSLMS
jgi:rubrerythrin